MADPGVCLSLEQVGLTIGRQHILSGFSFEIADHSVTALIGPNACGKSALIDILSTLVPPTFGEITVFGVALSRANAAALRSVRRQIGTVFEDCGLIDGFTIEENVALPLVHRGASRPIAQARTEKWLRKLGLLDIRHALPDRVSDGQLRRAGLARALVCRPRLLLCDEPTTGQDTAAQAAFNTLLGRLKAEYQMTVAFATHDIPAALTVANQVVVIDFGRMAFAGSPEALAAALPGNARVREILGPEGEAALTRRLAA